MPRKPISSERTVPLAVRVSESVAQAVHDAAGDDLGAWLRDAVETKLGGSGGLGGARRSSPRDEGWRAGWTAANRQFREALRQVLDSDLPEPT